MIGSLCVDVAERIVVLASVDQEVLVVTDHKGRVVTPWQWLDPATLLDQTDLHFVSTRRSH